MLGRQIGRSAKADIVIKLLIAAGADLNSKQQFKDHDTPLLYAIKHNRTEIAEFLRQAGAR